MSTKDGLRNFIVTELGWRGPELTDDYPLLENHVIDSLGVFQIVEFLESEYGVSVPDEELVPEKFSTLASIAEIVDRESGDQAA